MNTYSPFQNVNNIMAENDQLKNDCANLSIQNQNYQNQLNAVINQSHGMHMTDQETIRRLCGTIASMKAQTEIASREFYRNSQGTIWCRDPSGKKREVGYLRETNGFILISTDHEQDKTSIVVTYETKTHSKTTIIPMEDIQARKLIKYFSHFEIKCSPQIANDYLYHLLMAILENSTAVITIPEFPGIVFQKKGGAFTRAKFVCSEARLPDIYTPFVSEAYRKKQLPAVSNTCETILANLKQHMNSNTKKFLLTCLCAAPLSSYMKQIHYNFTPILSVSFSSLASKQLTSIFLKTYCRDKQPYSLTMSNYELINLLKQSKDEFIVLVDDTISETRNKRTKAIDTILDFQSNADCKPFMTAVISNEIQHYLPQGMGIFLETSEDFGKEYSEKERAELSKQLDEMLRYFVETFCGHIGEYDVFLQKNIGAIKAAEKDTFSSDSLCTAYAVLLSVHFLWARIFHVEPSLDFEEYLKKVILDSQDFEGGKTFSVIDSFFKLLNNFIAEEKFQVVRLDREMQYEKGSDTIIIDGELMLMEEHILKDYFLPEITEAQTVNGILNPLAKHECLVATNGHKKPTTVYDSDGMANHINLVAIKYSDMVTSETRKRIDSLSGKKYFTDKAEEPDFLPLVQNVFGQYAGQVLKAGENLHHCITGISGMGKTVFMTQLMARLAQKRKRVIVFDSSDSFSKEELEKSLSKEFIQQYISFHDISESGLPVHLMYPYPDYSVTKQTNCFGEIISQAMPNASQIQINFLKKALKECVAEQDFDYESLLCVLDIGFPEVSDSTKDSVYSKLNDVFEEIIEYGHNKSMTDWYTFLESCKNIVVIKVDEPSMNTQRPLTNMLLASLLQAQKHRKLTQEDLPQFNIFIDEIQNENLEKGSIISQIMREGRKYNLGLNISTQFIGSGRESHTLRQAGINVYFKPDSNSRRAVAEALGLNKKDLWKIDKLGKGECFIHGLMKNFETGTQEEATIIGKTCLLPDSPFADK